MARDRPSVARGPPRDYGAARDDRGPRRADRGLRSGRQAAAPAPDAQRLQSIPGIGAFGAALLLAEIGAIGRFLSAHELAAYAGLVPSTRSSGDKTAHGGVGQASNHWLKWILIEAVPTLRQVPGPVRFHFERLLRAKGKPTATVAAARKLSTYIYWMWTQGLSYPAWLEAETKRAGCPMQTLASSA